MCRVSVKDAVRVRGGVEVWVATSSVCTGVPLHASDAGHEENSFGGEGEAGVMT